MKKRILIILCGIILITTTACNNSKDKNDTKEKFMLGTSLQDGKYISFTFEVPYLKDNENLYLSDSLLNGTINITDFLNNLNQIDTLRDGGSKLYKYDKDKKIFGDDDFYVIECNSLDGIQDIFVAKNKEILLDKCSVKIDDLKGVSMIIKDGTLTNKSATVIITDTSDKENIYGEFYKIEKLENDNWVELKANQEMFFNDIGYVVNDEKKLELDINWEMFYGQLTSGRYRIVKSTSEVGEGIVHYITVEFTIE